MGLTISSSGGDYENLEPGRYQATCYKLIDAGTREESYQEGPLRKRHIVYIYWEVTAKQEVDDGEEQAADAEDVEAREVDFVLLRKLENRFANLQNDPRHPHQLEQLGDLGGDHLQKKHCTMHQ